RFHRVKNTRSRTHEGTGIGLALVQELVRLHGGDVGVQSEEGRGTIFTVRIPTGASHLPPDRINAARQRATTALGATPFVEEALRWLPASGAETGWLGRESAEPVSMVLRGAADSATPPARIVIADDNADMRDYLRRLLEGDYDVEAVADGQAA